MDDYIEKRRLSAEKGLKERYPDIDFESIYNKKYKDLNLHTIVCQLQPLINKAFYDRDDENEEKDNDSDGDNENDEKDSDGGDEKDTRAVHLFFAYFRKGGDPEYFTSGAGAPGNCCLM